MEFPTAEQLAQTDVLVMYAEDAGNITPEQRPILEAFIKRGGGIVVIHTAAVANKPDTRRSGNRSSAVRGCRGRRNGRKARWTSTTSK